MKTRTKLLLTGALLSLAASSHAAEDNQLFGGTLNGNVNFASDYVFRGESETLDGDIPVVQGTLVGTTIKAGMLGYLAPTLSLQTQT